MTNTQNRPLQIRVLRRAVTEAPEMCTRAYRLMDEIEAASDAGIGLDSIEIRTRVETLQAMLDDVNG